MTQTHLPFFEISSRLPPEEQDAIRAIPSSELPPWARTRLEEYRARVRELEGHIATFSSLCNAHAPVSRLPNEVLGRIFAEPPIVRQWHPLRSIGSVCRHWLNVLLATPRFWAACLATNDYSRESNNTEFLHFALQRSSAIPLCISLIHPHAKVLNLISEYGGRIVELDIVLGGAGIRVFENFVRSGRITHLSSLSVRYPRKLNRRRTLGWNAETVPVLRILSISGCIAPRIIVSSLETIEIWDVQVHLDMLGQILEQCPLLQVLTMRKLRLEDEHPRALEHRINLEKLQELIFEQTPGDTMGRVLQYFSTSIITPITLLVRLTVGGEPSQTIPDFSRFHFEGITAPPLIDRLCVEAGPSSCTVFSGYAGQIERLQIKAVNHEGEPILNLLGPFLVCPISVLVPNVETRDKNAYMHAGLVDALPHLRRLELPHSAARAVKHLSASTVMHVRGDTASTLVFAWVLRVGPGAQGLSGAAGDLKGLLKALRQHMATGKPRLGRLELYARRAGHVFTRTHFEGRIDAGSDAQLCSEIVGPFLPRLREVADVVVVG